MNSAERYLRLSNAYCDALGGVRWSAQDDALEYPDGSTFAFNGEVAQFLEGFASGGRLIHICFVLHLLCLVRTPQRTVNRLSGSLLGAVFTQTGRQLRNAGVFAAVLCQDIPEVAGPVDPNEVLDRLRDLTRPLRWFTVNFHDTFFQSELPPLGPSAFEEEILGRLEPYTTEELTAWLRHGRGPVKEAGKRLARALPPPRTLAGALAALLERPRLAGARPFIAQMLSAVALPPLRRVRPQLALGGYAEVATHGQPDQLLLSQFALDEWDFLRRYADRELLYFRREDPQVQSRHELVVLLDQGVRTWGDVRLVLGAAALALGKLAVHGKIAFRMAATSRNGEPLDPVAIDGEALGEMVEASDLSANPGLALERLLEEPVPETRDVVLLTHPRNLMEEDVRTAALRATAATRVLALTLDANGQAALSELRHGVPVALRQFRVDFKPSPVVHVPTSEPTQSWRGDIEPVGFPFRFGTGRRIGADLFDFDHDGQWLLTATVDGMLYAWKTDGSGQMELLPRPMAGGLLINDLQAVVGIAGGFAVIGRQNTRYVVAQYDFGRRTCKVYVLDESVTETNHDWCYSAEDHTLLSFSHDWEVHYHGLDLGTGFRKSWEMKASDIKRSWKHEATSMRIWRALQSSGNGRAPPRRLLCHSHLGIPRKRIPDCVLVFATGELRLTGLGLPLKFLPLANGQPVLKGFNLVAAQCRGNMLAVCVQSPNGKPIWLRLFRGPDGVPLAEYPVTYSKHGFTLSRDGKLLARQVKGWRVEVLQTEGRAEPLIVTRDGGFSSEARFLLGEMWLLVSSGSGNRYRHLLRWKSGRLDIRHTMDDHRTKEDVTPLETPEIQTLFGPALPAIGGWPAPEPGGITGIPLRLKYDPTRFFHGVTTTVTAILDRFGQIAIFDGDYKLVCMFFPFRNQLSGWLPDGTCFGPASHTGQPPTTSDLDKFGRALADAAGQGRAEQ